MIKAYSIRYKEEMKVIDVAERAEAIDVHNVQEAGRKAEFVDGLHAITLEGAETAGVSGEIKETEYEGEEQTKAEEKKFSEEEKAAFEQRKEQEIKKIKYELSEAEKLALRIEMEKQIRTQADVILEQARSQGEQVKIKAKLAAEAEKAELFETAKKEGYAAGEELLRQERAAMEAEFAQKKQELVKEYEQKAKELEPLAVEVVIGLLERLTGVLLETKKGVLTYLVSRALSEAERSENFLIRVSREDFEEVKGAAGKLREMFDREVTLEVTQDVLLKKGECMIETDVNIIDCSLETQMKGLTEDIRLLSAQERA